jgi:hypothetical protein
MRLYKVALEDKKSTGRKEDVENREKAYRLLAEFSFFFF